MKSENGSDSDSTELQTKIIAQVEYYFGDYNLTRDKFLQEAVKIDDGWVPLETLIKFNRLKQLSTDFQVIGDALKKSDAHLLELSEDGTKVRRSTDKPLPENDEKRKEDINSRSAYAKGFPKEATLDELLCYFKQQGLVEHIQMRYLRSDKIFKGSVFAVFKTKEEAEAFVKKESVKYDETELQREMKNDYLERKHKERLQSKEERKKKKGAVANVGDQQEETPAYEKGRVLYICGLPENVTREELKSEFSSHATVAWIDFNKGDSQAWIRFREDTPAGEVVEKIKQAKGGLLKFNDSELTHRVLEGEEEEQYWVKVVKAKQESFNKRHKSNRGRGKSHFKRGGGRGQNRHSKNGQEENTSDVKESAKRAAESSNESEKPPKMSKTEIPE